MTVLNQRQNASGIRTHQEAQEWERAGGVRHRLLTAEDVAERLNIPKTTVYEGAKRGGIGGLVRVGRLLRFHPDKFEAWLEAGGQALPGGWRQEEAA
jgi:excisionase family DNA binding protein